MISFVIGKVDDDSAEVLLGGITCQVFEEYGYLQVHLMAVEQDFQGAGLGSKLLDCAKDFARSAGLSKIYLYSETSENVLKFYTKNEFKAKLSIDQLEKEKRI